MGSTAKKVVVQQRMERTEILDIVVFLPEMEKIFLGGNRRIRLGQEQWNRVYRVREPINTPTVIPAGL